MSTHARTADSPAPSRSVSTLPKGHHESEGGVPSPPPGIAMTDTFVGAGIAAMGLVLALSVPGLSVPITIQSMGVMLAGIDPGQAAGAAAVTIFLLLAALGLPLLSGGAAAWPCSSGRALISARLPGRRLRDRVVVRAAQHASVTLPLYRGQRLGRHRGVVRLRRRRRGPGDQRLPWRSRDCELGLPARRSGQGGAAAVIARRCPPGAAGTAARPARA